MVLQVRSRSWWCMEGTRSDVSDGVAGQIKKVVVRGGQQEFQQQVTKRVYQVLLVILTRLDILDQSMQRNVITLQ
jgi:hypothetical protein